VIGAECLLVDREGTFEKRLGLGKAPLCAIDLGEIVETTADLCMARTEYPFVERQCAIEERLGLGVAVLRSIEFSEIVEMNAHVRVLGAERPLVVTIPIVFISGTNPVESGLVASFNRPGANITGVSVLSTPMAAKRLELLREVVPTADRIAIVVNPSNPNAVAQLRDFQASASTRRQKIIVTNASNEAEIDNAFAALARQRVGALLVGADAFLGDRGTQLSSRLIRSNIVF